MNKMTTVKAATEIRALEAFIHDKKLNLPEVLFLSSDEVKKAYKEIDKLQVVLTDVAKIEEAARVKDEMEKAKSAELFKVMLTDTRVILEDLKTKFSTLHPSFKPRYFEIVKSLSEVVR